MTTSDTGRELLWAPSEERVRASRMTAYLDWLARERGLRFAGYEDLWRWSIDDLDGFWRSIWDYFDVVATAPPAAVLADRRMPGATWFPDARLNWAENVLRHAVRRPPGDRRPERGRATGSCRGPDWSPRWHRWPPSCARSACGRATGSRPTCRTSRRR